MTTSKPTAAQRRTILNAAARPGRHSGNIPTSTDGRMLDRMRAAGWVEAYLDDRGVELNRLTLAAFRAVGLLDLAHAAGRTEDANRTAAPGECDECGENPHPGKPCRTAAEILAECAPPADYTARFRAERAASIARHDAQQRALISGPAEQGALFGDPAAVDAPAAPAEPTNAGDVQLSLFRPDFRAVRAPQAPQAGRPGRPGPGPARRHPDLTSHRRPERTGPMICTDQNGRRYRLIKVYRDGGQCMERDTFRRYDIVKRYL